MATDRISNLSDDILGKILSLVPTKLAASTSVLSKRWKSLLPLVDSLDFDESMLFYPDTNEQGVQEATSLDLRQHSFSNFVDKTLALLSTYPLIKKFSLKCHYHSRSLVNRWICTALERGCLELNLESDYYLRIDSKFFTSKSLVKLTMSLGFHPFGPLPSEGVFFPALKTLSLVSVSFKTRRMFKFFIQGCPMLEELFIYEHEWITNLSSPTVKRVTIINDFNDDHCQRSIRLETPNLLYLEYSSYVAKHYFVSLDSLAEARLDLRLDEPCNYEDKFYGNITSLIEGMRNIKSLHLSPDSLEVFYFCCPSMPVLKNLLRLYIEFDREENWQAVPRLLDNSPNLQTLVIKGLVHVWFPTKNKEMVCCLSKCRVKVLEISGYTGSLGELKQMRFFFEKLECLESVKVGVEEDTINSNYLRANLMALPRVSSKCNIQFI